MEKAWVQPEIVDVNCLKDMCNALPGMHGGCVCFFVDMYVLKLSKSIILSELIVLQQSTG